MMMKLTGELKDETGSIYDVVVDIDEQVVTPPPPPAGGIDPNDVVVVINSADPESAGIAAAYVAARGIPSANVITVNLGGSYATPEATDAAVVDAKSAIDAKGKEYTQLCMRYPSRTQHGQSITSALSFGKHSTKSFTVSPFYGYDGLKPYTDKGYRQTMLLLSADHIHATAVLNSGTSYSVLAKDQIPPVRGAVRKNQTDPGLVVFNSMTYPDSNIGGGQNPCNELSLRCTWIAGRLPIEPVNMYFASMNRLEADSGSINFLPGFYGDTLTSYSGNLPDGYRGSQTPLTWFLDRGACASSGTVEEPSYRLADQFVNISIFRPLFMTRVPVGTCLWASVKCPDRNLFAGDLMFRSAFA